MKDRTRPTSAEDAARFVRDSLYLGPVYRKLYALRQRRPELSHELDDLAVALKQTGDRIEEFVRDQAETVTPPRTRPGATP